MDIKGKINELRRTVMRKMTKNIGASHFDRTLEPATHSQIKRILICRPNHRLGNLLLITPLVQEISDTFPDCKVDLFTKGGISPVIFKNYDNVDRIIQLPRKPFGNLIKYLNGWISLKKNKYDIVVNASKNSSSGRLSVQLADSRYKFFGDDNEDAISRHRDYKHLAKNPVYSFRHNLSRIGLEESDKPVPPLNLKLSPGEIDNGRKKLLELVNNEKRTICLYTFATSDKCYPIDWWENFYDRLKSRYQDFNIIEVLPIENVSQIAFKAPSFYSKDIREIGALIANTEVFIGADCGIMHLASSVDTPTIGLFSVTNQNIYQPYNPGSAAINTNNATIDDCFLLLDKILNHAPYPAMTN